MADDNDIRVGHPERERAISLLNDSFSAGYLEIVEFEERSGMIIAARTRGELRDTLRDLPNAAMLFPAAAVAPTPATSEVTPIEYNANWETLRRTHKARGRRRLTLAYYDTPAHHAGQVLAGALSTEVWLDIR